MRPARALALLAACAALAAAPAAADAASALDAPTKVLRLSKKQKVGYRSIGSGRPIVMIMGLGGSMGGWDPTFLDGVAAAGHRVIIFDNEGVGRSSALPGTLSIRRMATTTAKLVRKLRLRKPDVAGWSMGGMIAQRLAVREPRLVRRLALFATAPGDGQATPPSPDALELLAGGGGDLNALFDLLFPADQTAARDRYVQDLVLRRPFEGLAPPDVISKQTAASAAWLIGQDRAGRRIAKLRLPVLVAGGDQDMLLPVANQRHLADVIPNAELVTYPDAAHAFLFQHQDEFLVRLGEFFG